MAVEREKGNRLGTYVPDYVVFDLETTGTSVNSDKIIEISAVKVKNGEVEDTFSSLVNPERKIPFFASRVNGITDEMVADAPTIEEILPAFLEFTKDMVLVGHNIHNFDMNFIYDEVMNLYGTAFQNEYIDTLSMARECLPQLSHHKLSDVSAYFGISTEGAHRALNDCIMNQQCFEELGKLQQNLDVEICPKCGGTLKKRSGKFGEFYGCTNFPNCRFTKNA